MPALDAVWVSTSTDVHARQTLDAVERGLHVLCEKPLSTDLVEVRIQTLKLLFFSVRKALAHA